MNFLKNTNLPDELINNILEYVKHSPKQLRNLLCKEIQQKYQEAYNYEFNEFDVYHWLDLDEEIDHDIDQLKKDHFPDYISEDIIINSFKFHVFYELP
jgi:hypothetical protein